MDRLDHGSVSMELTRHCNLKCARCDHASPWFDESMASFDQYVRDFDALTAVMTIDELRFSGGEALLHPELPRFLQTARERTYARGLVLLSNGVLVPRMSDEVWQLIDVLQVTLYPGIKLKIPPDELFARGRRHRTTVVLKHASVFQQMLINDPLGDPRVVETVYRGCSAAVNCHTVFEGRFYRCSRAHLLEERMAKAGRTVSNRQVDGVDLHTGGDLRAILAAYLAEDRPLMACNYCLGDSGRRFEHVQLRRKADIEREQRERHGDAREVLAPTAFGDPAAVERPTPSQRGWWRYGADDEAWADLEALEDA